MKICEVSPSLKCCICDVILKCIASIRCIHSFPVMSIFKSKTNSISVINLKFLFPFYSVPHGCTHKKQHNYCAHKYKHKCVFPQAYWIFVLFYWYINFNPNRFRAWLYYLWFENASPACSPVIDFMKIWKTNIKCGYKCEYICLSVRIITEIRSIVDVIDAFRIIKNGESFHHLNAILQLRISNIKIECLPI